MTKRGEAAFTPGPWIVDGKYVREVKPWNEEGRQLAVALVTNTSRVYVEVRANARLIAAAPKLYQAVKRLIAISENSFAVEDCAEVKHAIALLEAIHG